MHLAVENKKNNIGFFKIDRRQLNDFIKKVESEIKDVKTIWVYDYLERNKNNSGVFKGTKIIKNY